MIKEKHDLLKSLSKAVQIETQHPDLSPSSRTEDNSTVYPGLQTPDRGINLQTGLLRTLFSTSRLLD